METIIGGFIGFVAAFSVFVLGFVFGRKTAQKPEPEIRAVSADELAKIRKEREQLEAEQDAFRALVGYSADVAYGLADFPLGGEA